MCMKLQLKHRQMNSTGRQIADSLYFFLDSEIVDLSFSLLLFVGYPFLFGSHLDGEPV